MGVISEYNSFQVGLRSMHVHDCSVINLVKELYFTGLQGGHPLGIVREFNIGQGKVTEIRISSGNCGLPVMCYHSCGGNKRKKTSTVK